MVRRNQEWFGNAKLVSNFSLYWDNDSKTLSSARNKAINQMKKLRILSDTLSSHTDAQKTTNQFVEIFPNLWNTDSNSPSLTVDTMFVGTNGSLIFQNTFSYHTGRYLCHVSNGIGHAIHQIVNVNVKGIHSSKFTFSCVVYLLYFQSYNSFEPSFFFSSSKNYSRPWTNITWKSPTNPSRKRKRKRWIKMPCCRRHSNYC